MSFEVKAWGAELEVSTKIVPVTIKRRAIGPNDIKVVTKAASICHSDLHWKNGDWGKLETRYAVPGHELIGVVEQVGENVTNVKAGDWVGLGCMVGTNCTNENGEFTCHSCTADKDERFCEKGMIMTYGSPEVVDGEERLTAGYYSTAVVVDSKVAVKVPEFYTRPENLKHASPILCAGVTCYSPFRRLYGAVTAENPTPAKGKLIGVNGIGGLGWFAIRNALSMGAQVVAFTRSAKKIPELLEMGCTDVVLSTDPEQLKKYSTKLDLIVDTVSAVHDIDSLLVLLRTKGNYCIVGAPEKHSFSPFSLLMRELNIFGSPIGSIEVTQEIIDLCAKNEVKIPVEVVAFEDINEAYERMLKSDVHYRFAIDPKDFD